MNGLTKRLGVDRQAHESTTPAAFLAMSSEAARGCVRKQLSDEPEVAVRPVPASKPYAPADTLGPFGGRITARNPDRQTAKIHIRIALMGRVSAPGTAESVRVT
jgi:hypothetical protein